MSSVSFRQAKDAELTWIDGEIHFSSATSKGIIGMDEEKMEESTADLIPVLDAPSLDQVRVLSEKYFLALLKLLHIEPTSVVFIQLLFIELASSQATPSVSEAKSCK